VVCKDGIFFGSIIHATPFAYCVRFLEGDTIEVPVGCVDLSPFPTGFERIDKFSMLLLAACIAQVVEDVATIK
jgi:hypothetical protein